MKTLTKVLSLLLVVAMVFVLASCGDTNTPLPEQPSGGSQAGTPSNGAGAGNGNGNTTDSPVTVGPKNLVFAVNRDITDISPFGARTAARTQFMHLLFNYLFCVPTMTTGIEGYQPEVASDYEVLDAETVRISIFDYIHDSKGNAIKAEDVKFCYDTALNDPGTGVFLAPILKSVEIVDEYTVDFKVNPLSLGQLETLITFVPIFSKTWYENASNEELTKDPATTGSYKVGEMVTSSHLTLVKDEDYWQTDESLRSRDCQQPFDTIKFKVVLESAMEVIALENGEADVARQIPVTELDAFAGDEWDCFGSKNSMFYCLLFNNDNSAFAGNKELRQAVCYAIDQNALNMAFGNTAESGGICKAFGVDVFPDYNPDWLNGDYYSCNVDKAKGLMEQAGYADGLKVRVLYVQNTGSNAMMTILQQQLKEIGIEAELLAYDQAMFDTLKFNDKEWDICIDQKGGTQGFIATGWKTLFDPASYDNGSVCFTHDDKLTELLYACCDVDTHSQETVDAFNDYLNDQAYAYGLFWSKTMFVGQTSLGMNQDGQGEMCPGGWTPAPGYASLAD